MTAYLRSHKPARSQYRSPRRATVSGVIVIHSAENRPDFTPPDRGAEAVAQFIVGRSTPGSYHDLVDSDTAVHLVDWSDEAFHDGTDTNPHSLSISVATRADAWSSAPADWLAGVVEQLAQAAARQARWVKATTGIVVPPKRITAAQARARVPGFTTHAELDPGRRSDPGAGFPWQAFLTRFANLTKTPQEDSDDMLALIVKIYEKHEHDWMGDPAGVEFWERHGQAVGVKQLITDMLGAIAA